MKVTVTYINTGQKKLFQGEPRHIQQQLYLAYPWLARKKHETLQQDLDHLSRQQMLLVETEA